MSEVLIGQSYYLRFDPKLWAAMQPYPPLGSLYAASVLRARGYEVAFFDAMLAESEALWAQALQRVRPRFAILYEDNFNYLSKMCLLRMREAAFTMMAAAKARGCTVIAAGSDATDHADLYLDHGADFVLLGEGEAILLELMDHLTGREPRALEDILGLAWRDPADGTLRATPRRPVLRDLDALPWPAWDLVDLERYRALWLGRHGYFSINMVTTRGCPYHCNWCAKPIWGQRYNVRSPENVVAEMAYLRDLCAPDHIWFMDDILGLKPGWLARFAELVEQAGVRTPFKCLSRADLLLREGEVEALRRAGAQIVWIGVESGSQKILDAMEKGITVEQVYEVTRRLRQADIQVAFFLQFGYPGETRQDIGLTIQTVRDLLPDDIGISVSYPLPGTKFYERVKDQLGARQNWYDSEDLAMLYRGPFSTAFYRQLHRYVHLDFRVRRALAGLRQAAGWRARARLLATATRNALRLPLARLRLEVLARAPHQGIGPLPVELSPAEAARPSPQD